MTRVIKEPHWTFKLLPQAMRELGVEAQGVIHVGAHWGQEVPVYLELGFQSIVLVEPDVESNMKIVQQPWFGASQITLLPVAIDRTEGVAPYYEVRTGNGVWSGLKRNPDRPVHDRIVTVPTTTIASIQRTHPANVLVIDTQGTEMDALASATLEGVDLIIIETQVNGVDGAHPQALSDWAARVGWDIPIVWDRTGGWTDALLVPQKAAS